MNNTPDYNNNLAFAPGDWSDSRVTNNTDRTASTIHLIEKIEQLENENKELKKLLAQAQASVWLQRELSAETSLVWNELNNLFEEINKAL